MIHSYAFRILIAGILSSLLLLNACGSGNAPEGKKNQAPPIVEGFTVRHGHMDEELQLSGVLLPREETVLMPEISGRITMLNIQEGSFVSKGTLLVKIFDADLQAQASRKKVELLAARKTSERLAELSKLNGVSQQEYDNAVTLVSTLEAELALITAQISRTEIRAPFNGVLGLKKVSEGAYVTAGTAIVVLREEQNLKLDFSVPEAYANAVKKGMKVLFHLDGDTTAYSATVAATEQHVDQGSLNMQVRAEVDSHNKSLVAGSSALVKLQLGRSDSALLIPARAIVPDARYKKVLVSKNGVAQFVRIETGVRTAEEVEVLSGLLPGDTVVVSGIQFLRPGMKVNFSSVK